MEANNVQLMVNTKSAETMTLTLALNGQQVIPVQPAKLAVAMVFAPILAQINASQQTRCACLRLLTRLAV